MAMGAHVDHVYVCVACHVMMVDVVTFKYPSSSKTCLVSFWSNLSANFGHEDTAPSPVFCLFGFGDSDMVFLSEKQRAKSLHVLQASVFVIET